MHRNKPYSTLARYYDQVLPGVGAMNRHARETILAREWPRIGRMLEVACGTGETAVDLARKGIEIEAIDWSPTFVRRARERAAAAGVKVAVRRGDMRDFRVKEPVDFVLLEFSAINNLDDRRDLGKVMRCAARALKPGGLFLFDVNTPLTAQTQFTPAMWFEARDFKLVMRCALEDRDRRARLDLEWFLRDGGRRYRHVRETIVNVCWTRAEHLRALRAAGFRDVRVFDGVDVRPKTPGAVRGTDLYFLATKY